MALQRCSSAVTKWLPIFLFLVSLALPAYSTDDYPGRSAVYGIEVLFMGWAGLLVVDARWYANIVFVYSMWCSHSNRAPKLRWLCAILQGAAGLWTLARPYIHAHMQNSWMSGFGMDVQFEVGAYVWAASLSISALHVINSRNFPEKTLGHVTSIALSRRALRGLAHFQHSLESASGLSFIKILAVICVLLLASAQCYFIHAIQDGLDGRFSDVWAAFDMLESKYARFIFETIELWWAMPVLCIALAVIAVFNKKASCVALAFVFSVGGTVALYWPTHLDFL